MSPALSLIEWSYVAQCVIAVAALVALAVAGGQIWVTRATAKRVRVYEYADKFNQPEMRRRAGEWREYVEANTYEDFAALKWVERNDRLLLANVIEEVAAMYNRGMLDRSVAAEAVGFYVEGLWEASKKFVAEMRAAKGPRLFADWEHMVEDTPGRKLKADASVARRRTWRKLLRGK